MLCLLFVRTQTNFGIKTFEIDFCKYNFMMFDLLTSPQGHQVEPRENIVPAFCSSHHPRRFDMLHGHVWTKNILTPGATKSHP